MSIDDQSFRNFVEKLKEEADLVDVIQTATPEYHFERAGKWMRCRKPDSLMVDPHWQQYTWFSQAGTGGHAWETGDVFDWLTRHNNMDFWGACEFLASRLGIQIPRGVAGTRNEDGAQSVRLKYEIYEVAHKWFMDQLRASAAALDYCRRIEGGRAFADETICWQATAEEVLYNRTDIGSIGWRFLPATVEKAKAVELERRDKTMVVHGAGLGFSGGTAEAAEDLRQTFRLYKIDPENPMAVALCGLRSGARGWCEKHQVEPQENWLKTDRIYGMADFPRLVYPHFQRGKVTYFSGRGLTWDGKRLIGDPDKAHKSWNPPTVLAGERQRYYNWLFNRRGESVIIVEGQADAIALGELGFAAAALCGLAADQPLAELLRAIPLKYIALDDDKYGQAAMLQVAQLFGPMTRLVIWGGGDATIDEEEDSGEGQTSSGEDPLIEKAMELIRERADVTVSHLQRHMRIGYTRAARIMDQLEEREVVGPSEAGKHPVLVETQDPVLEGAVNE